NLDDESTRHLMVIGKSDSIVTILTYQVIEKGLDPIVILGSQFQDDQQGYSYRVLSRIMICVESGRPLILTDLEIVYGALYDLWNQSYIVSGSINNPKFYTRVALGAYINPMLFEKQRMIINDILTDDHQKIVKILSTSTQQMVSMKVTNTLRTSFTRKDLFIGFDENETLQTALIDIASSDGIIRASRSIVDPGEIDQYISECLRDLFTCQVNKLSTFMTEAQLQNRIKRFWEESEDQMLVVQCDVTTVDAGWIKLAKFIIEQFQNEFSRKNPDYIKYVSRALEWIKENSTDDWQFIVASDKKLLYPYTSFSAALLAYLRLLVRHPIAKILFVLEKLSVTKSIVSINQTRRNQDLIPFLKTSFLDPIILNINDLPEPKPDRYTAWGDELEKLREIPDNCDDDELSHVAFENAVQGFNENVKTSLLAINDQVFTDFSERFFYDFVTVMVANDADKKDSELFAKLVQLYIGKDKAFDPVLLHIYWWKHSNVILADLQLVQMFPTVINEFADEGPDVSFEEFLVDKVIKIMLDRFEKKA
ncbi:41261_t:CDS:2, partial [Gigaspora margarita]